MTLDKLKVVTDWTIEATLTVIPPRLVVGKPATTAEANADCFPELKEAAV